MHPVPSLNLPMLRSHRALISHLRPSKNAAERYRSFHHALSSRKEPEVGLVARDPVSPALGAHLILFLLVRARILCPVGLHNCLSVT